MTRRLLPLACLLAALLAPAVASAARPRAAHPAARPAAHHGRHHRVHGPRAVPQLPGTFFIRGGGFGHGIGLSQYGAYGYALHGKDYRYILAHYYTGTALGHTDPNQTVRVLLSTGSAAFSGATGAAGKKLRPDWTYTVKALADGSLALLDPHGKPVVAHAAAPLVAGGSAPLTVAGLGSYRGSLEFRPDGHGGVQTVDALGLDDYVRGVISAEMPADWAPAALEAQAVAARTYALTTSVSGNGYTLYPDTRSQMYRGVAAETPSTDAAVAATRGQIVTYDGQPVVTYFFSSSGGYTESIENVWPGATPEPWLRGVPDPYDGVAGNPYHHWGSDLTMSAAAQRLGSLVKGQLIGIRVLRHGASPRILEAAVVGTRGSVRVSGLRLQSIFGLQTTYVAFTSIITMPGRAPAGARDHGRRHRALSPAGMVAAALKAVGPGVRALLSAIAPGLQGTVYPSHRRQVIAIQELVGGRWHTVAHTRLGSGGAYSVRLHEHGRYRVVYRGLAGPATSA